MGVTLSTPLPLGVQDEFRRHGEMEQIFISLPGMLYCLLRWNQGETPPGRYVLDLSTAKNYKHATLMPSKHLVTADRQGHVLARLT